MIIEKIYFESIDNLNLIGLIHKPDNQKTDAVVISVHGITSNCLKYRDDILAKKITNMGISYFAFNNRGHDIINTYDKITDDNMHFYGSAAENIYDSYFDIKAAILKMQELGYKKIILQGHSMGCTKVVYTYNELLKNNESTVLELIKGVILLSMVDVPTYIEKTLGKDYKRTITYLQMRRKRGKGNELVMLDPNFPPVKPNTILNYVDDNKKINFAKFGDGRTSFKQLNNIKEPLFMRWGNVNELILQDARVLANTVNEKIKNKNKDISYIDGANHNYIGKEEILGDEICNFLSRNEI